MVFPTRVDLLALVPAALVAVAAEAMILPPGSGPLTLVMIVEPHLLIVTIAALTPLALWRRARTLGALLLVAVLMGGCLSGSEWISLPGAGASRQDISVMSWNVQYGSRTPAEQAVQLESVTADLVDLQEVEPDAAEAILGDAALTARYPYRAMAPRKGARGLAVLSRYPIFHVDSTANPSCLDLLVETPRGSVHVIAAHPVHAEIGTFTPLRLPFAYDPSNRDTQIAVVRTRIDAALAAGDRLLVLGDYNTTPLEPGYSVLTHGLRDTHVQVGEGPGWTWRPSRFTFLPIGFLRIDLQLTGGSIYPTSTSIDCSLPGDHCRLFGGYEID